ncbi:hypothetical protein [Dongia sedimenti]|uniref:UrcA family protein n=1 Tax=Dongia sedimenti TaxID=3064282 RepID=A0ABU0YI64_9PROT|nr:hypothetical protein [Rhodospirillaceae bacterium R-7]
MNRHRRSQGSSQRRSRAAIGSGLAGLVLAALLIEPAPAEESPYARARREHPALFKVYYDEIVTAYCGLQTAESEAGFRLERDALLAAEPLSEETHRTVRVASDIAADYAYQDHGLSGQKRWCGTEGRAAYDRFVTRHRAQPTDPAAEAE